LVTVTAIFLITILFVVVRVHDDGGRFLSEELIKDGFVHQAAFTVIDNHLTLITVRFDLFLEVFCNMLTYFTNTGRVIHDSFHVDTAGQLVLFVPCKTCFIGHCIEFTIQLVFVHMKLNRNRFKVKR